MSPDATPSRRAAPDQQSTDPQIVEAIVGRVGRAHGLRGDVVVEVRTDEPDVRFADGAVLRCERGVFHVARSRWNGGSLVVGLAEVTDRTAAEELRGQLLVVDVDAAARPSDPEEYYDRQLRGLRAVSVDGRRLGTVTDVIHLPAQDLLAVDSEGDEHLIPFVSAIVPRVDLDAGTLTVAEPGGLLDGKAEEAR